MTNKGRLPLFIFGYFCNLMPLKLLYTAVNRTDRLSFMNFQCDCESWPLLSAYRNQGRSNKLLACRCDCWRKRKKKKKTLCFAAVLPNLHFFFLTDPVWSLWFKCFWAALGTVGLNTPSGFRVVRVSNAAITSLQYLTALTWFPSAHTQRLRCLVERSGGPHTAPWCFVTLSFVRQPIPQTATTGPDQFARPGNRRQCSNDVLKWGVCAALTARCDAAGPGEGLRPVEHPHRKQSK